MAISSVNISINSPTNSTTKTRKSTTISHNRKTSPISRQKPTPHRLDLSASGCSKRGKTASPTVATQPLCSATKTCCKASSTRCPKKSKKSISRRAIRSRSRPSPRSSIYSSPCKPTATTPSANASANAISTAYSAIPTPSISTLIRWSIHRQKNCQLSTLNSQRLRTSCSTSAPKRATTTTPSSKSRCFAPIHW